ncbi:hypothetical protein E9993_05275 [Labilibacter sediminis]|nr:hypothetical protein E9993_05275 [Labilibacter sediminis]
MSEIFKSFKSTAIQSAFYSIGNLAGKLSGVILLPVYALYLPIEIFGLYALFEVIFQLFQVFSGLGIKLGLTRWYWDEDTTPNKKSLFFTTFTFNVAICILLSIALYFGFNYLSVYYFKTDIQPDIILLFISGNLIKLLSDVPMLLLRVQHRAKKHSFVQIIQLLVFVGLVVVFLAVFKMKLEGIFWATLLSAIIQFVILVPVIIANSELKFEFRLLKDMLTYGFPVALGNMVNITFNFTDKYFINWFSNLKNVGTFTLAHKISNIVNLLIVNAFINAYMHTYFKGVNSSSNDRFFSRSFTYFLTGITFCSLILIVFIDEAIVLFAANNESYFNSATIVPVLTIGLVFGGIRHMLTLPINKIKRTRVIGVISILSGALNVYLNYLLIPIWYSLGAAYATGIVQVISSLVLLIFVLKNLNIVFEWKRIFILFLDSAIVLLALYIVHIDHLLLNLLYKTGLVIFWILFIYLSGFLLIEEKRRIKHFWLKWKKLSSLLHNIKSLKDK